MQTVSSRRWQLLRFRIQYEVILWSASKTKAGLGPVHTNLAIFETAFFLHESGIRPQETNRSTIQKGILLNPAFPPPPFQRQVWDPLHTNQCKKYI